jgi:hypothetical protein
MLGFQMSLSLVIAALPQRKCVLGHVCAEEGIPGAGTTDRDPNSKILEALRRKLVRHFRPKGLKPNHWRLPCGNGLKVTWH